MSAFDDRFRAEKAELDRLRPLTHAGYEALSAWYDVELTYTSNAIEGNTLTRSETAIVLEKGFTVSGKSLRDHMEAVGHRDALGYVRDLAARDQPIREMDIRQIHRLIMERTDRDEAGRYSRRQRFISGSSLRLPSPAEIKPLMSDFGTWLSRLHPSAEAAFVAHEKLVAIHPFSDGNGRTSRLLMNLLLFKSGYPPVVIGPEQRLDYIDGLEALQLHGDAEPYYRFMADRLDASLNHHLDILRA